MDRLKSLLDLVESTPRPDRLIDRAIGMEIGGWTLEWVATPSPTLMLKVGENYYPDYPGSMYPAYTESVDDALNLLPSAAIWRASNDLSFGAQIKLAKPTADGIGVHYADSEWFSGNGMLAATSLVAALIRALIASDAPPATPIPTGERR